MREMFSKKRYLIIDFYNLPQEIRKAVLDWNDNISHDCYIVRSSEFDLDNYKNFDYEIQAYWNDQKGNVRCTEDISTLENFIEAYGLEFDVWMGKQVQQGLVNLDDVDDILIYLG